MPMTDVATKLTAERHTAIGAGRIEQQSGSVRYLCAVALIVLGGIITVAWIAFIGWAVGALFRLW
jgi:uncharacterized protein (DUF697 family)